MVHPVCWGRVETANRWGAREYVDIFLGVWLTNKVWFPSDESLGEFVDVLISLRVNSTVFELWLHTCSLFREPVLSAKNSLTMD